MIVPARTAEERATLLAYLASKIGTTPQGLVGTIPYEVVAVKTGSRTVGAVLYINYRDTSIEMACAGEPGWLTRANLRDLFGYPFTQLKVFTVLSMVQRRNRTARDFNTKLGFTELCVIRNGVRDIDTILYGMSRDECPWLEKIRKPTQATITATGVHAHG